MIIYFKINDNLEKQLNTLYDYWFIQFNFPNESGKPYKSSGGKMIWNEILRREIPEGWVVKSLDEILKKNNSVFDYSSNKKTVDLSIMPSDSFSLSRLNCSSKFTTNLFTMKKGDILFGSIRPYLHKAGFAPCDGVVAGTVHSYTPYNPYDFNFALITMCRNTFFDYAIRVSTGTKMPVVSSDALLDYIVPYSKEIVILFSNIDILNQISNNIKEIQLLNNLRDWLLPLLMNDQATIE